MRVCVIGGGGFIGLWLVQQLLERGDTVVVMGRSARPAALPAQADYVQAPYGESDMLARVLARVDSVVHLAYATVPSTSFSDPIFDLLSNTPPSVALFQQIATHGTGRLVLVSSGGTVYGNAAGLPLREDAPTNPISPYGITKLAIEGYANMYHALMGLPLVTVRPGNAYGLRRDGTPGGGFVMAAFRSLATGVPLQVFGNGDETVRDYVHVGDIAAGIVAALYHGELGRAYNIGTGVGTSNNEVIRMAAATAGVAPEAMDVRYLPSRGFDVGINILDGARLRAAAGWQPRLSLAQGMQATWPGCR